MRNVLAAIIFLFSAAYATEGEDWHHQLYLGNDGYWRQRVRVDIENRQDREVAGEPAALHIGERPGEANLVGALAEAVRVCDSQGAEMLYNITGPDGRIIKKGPIPTGGVIIIPVECPPHATATYYIYFGNPTAWAVPDFLDASIGVRNGGLEEGTETAPTGWRHDAQDEQHRVFWVTENPHSGKRCLKTIVGEGAEPTWIATRQRGIHIIGGAKCIMRAWVKAKNVKGYAGWYIHVGNKDNFMIISPMLSGGGGDYDWKEVTAEFTAPKEADIADLGTVLRGTGTAWFDDVALECARPVKLTVTAHKPETLRLREFGVNAKWYDENPRDDLRWDYRAPVKLINFTDRPLDKQLIYADISPLISRLHGKVNEDSIRVVDGVSPVAHYRFKTGLLFEGEAPANSVRAYYVYLSADERIKPAKGAGYASLLRSPRNLVKNPSFELGDTLPEYWPGGAEGARPAGVIMGFDEPGRFGKRCAKIYIPHSAKKAWTGWRQNVPVGAGKTYLYAAWLKCEDIQGGSVQIHAHYHNAKGELCKTKKFTGAGPPMRGDKDWTVLSGMFTMPKDIASFQLHLTMLATGTLWHDGVILAEVSGAKLGKLEARHEDRAAGVVVWPVNAIVKVFRDDVPPRRISPARISAARNEAEPLQLAIRTSGPLKEINVALDLPSNHQGAELSDATVNVVGYVPIDHKTNYYRADSPAWHRKYPTSPGACDGWPGMWPDPLLPRSAFDLEANTTQPIWITITVPKGAAPGDYTGGVRLTSLGRTLKEIPFTVHVWDFTLPDEGHLAAIYDLRLGPQWRQEGKSRLELFRQFWRFMARRRVCPNTVYPSPKISYKNGEVKAGFTDFDKAAEYYFDVLKLPHAYTPWYFYCFGWGHPPGKKFGEAPYEGKYPYEGADRSKLRPEFKTAYQACLRVYWNHLKEKGWDKKCCLYISDEPWYDRPPIRAQMKALCDMIHEADPAIPIYSSTWHHRPEWDGYLDVWGIGHYGVVTPEKMKELRAGGDRLWFTTDGQMCTDTPYCGVERLLPYYCFKYDVEAYEFWGVDWLTYNPYEFGWHSFIHQSGEPGKSTWVRYPNGDGFLAYPGASIGHDGPVSSVRLEQAREGVEDYEYLYLLRSLVGKAKASGEDAVQGEKALEMAKGLVNIPNAGGRYSTKILPNPDAVFEVKEAVARAIEKLSKAQ